ncbi:DUF6541 family protein [Arthrobacter sulfonylureivorans]|uniref:DUF6541 family protein n=1 Tax=Arthrobacter sulfonylureivorans TaxID=2486855 RepID=UPI0039E5BA4C
MAEAGMGPLTVAGQLAVMLAVFYLPGFLALRALRQPSIRALVLAPAAGTALAAVGTMACLLTGVRWNLLSAAVLAALGIGLCWLAGRAINPPEAPVLAVPRAVKWMMAASLAITALILGSVMIQAMGSIDRVSQAWDPTYHVNVLQWIKQNGQASPWSIWPIFGGAPPSFYPAGWHAMVSLIPGDVVTAGNLSCLIIGCVVWPTSLALLARALFPSRPLVWVLTPLIASSMLAFPLVQMFRAGQWPNSFAVALLPAILALGIELQYRLPGAVAPTAGRTVDAGTAADSESAPGTQPDVYADASPAPGTQPDIAPAPGTPPGAGASPGPRSDADTDAGTGAVVVAVGLSQTRAPRRRTTADLAALAMVTFGAAWIHPSALASLLVLGGVYLIRVAVLGLLRLWRSHRKQFVVTVSALAAAAVGVVVLLTQSQLLAAVMSYPRGRTAGWEDALVWLVFDLPRQPASADAVPGSYAVVVGILMVCGALLACFTARTWPAVAGMAAAVVLFILAAGPEDNPFRWLTGFWYTDPPRIAPLVHIFAVVFAALALDQLCTLLVRLIRPRRGRTGARAPTGARASTNVPPDTHARPDRQQLATAGLAFAVLAAVFVSTGAFRHDVRVDTASIRYGITQHHDGRALMGDEQDFIRSLGPLLPAGAVVIGDPFNGLPYIYSLTGHQTVYFQNVSSAGSKDKDYLRQHFRNIGSDPRVCPALRSTGATYLYDDQPVRGYQHSAKHQWPGFHNIDFSHGFRRIASHGSATLYEITACR